jgi:hypothetical protein
LPSAVLTPQTFYPAAAIGIAAVISIAIVALRDMRNGKGHYNEQSQNHKDLHTKRPNG